MVWRGCSFSKGRGNFQVEHSIKAIRMGVGSGGNYYCIPLGMTFVRDLASFWGVYLQRDTHRGKSCWLCRGSQFKDSNTIGHSPLQPVFQDEFMLSILPAGPCQDEELLLGLCYSQLCNLAGEKTATRPFQQRKPKACSGHFIPKASRKYRKCVCLYSHIEICMCIMNIAYCNAYHPIATSLGILSFPMLKGATRSALCWHKVRYDARYDGVKSAHAKTQTLLVVDVPVTWLAHFGAFLAPFEQSDSVGSLS